MVHIIKFLTISGVNTIYLTDLRPDSVYFTVNGSRQAYFYRPRSEGDNALGSVRLSVRPSVCVRSQKLFNIKVLVKYTESGLLPIITISVLYIGV